MKYLHTKRLSIKISAFFISISLLLTGCSVSNSKIDSNTQPHPDSSELFVHYIDVGQADCIFISLPNGKNMMIDAGNRDDFEAIDSYLSDISVDEIDSLILTHPHEDHIGSAADIINKYTPETVYMPDSTATTRVFENTLKAIAKNGAETVNPKPGDYIIDEKNLSMQVLAPNSDGYPTQNDYSIVTRLVYNDSSFMFTGDAEDISEEEILENGLDTDCDVLKVGHHGSSTSTSDDFLKAVSPEYAVIMCGIQNEYGHPHRETLDKLNNRDTKIYRTDKMGSIVCKTDGKNISFEYGNKAYTETESSEKEFKFIGNKNSKKFHTPECDNNMSEKNKVYFSSYEEAENSGYSPCSKCNPHK